VRWQDRIGVFHCDVGDSEHAEIVIADRTYLVRVADLREDLKGSRKLVPGCERPYPYAGHGPFFCGTDNSNLVFFAGEASVPANLAHRGLGLTSADVGRQKQEKFDRPAQAVSIPILKL
jgi:hypothetical protein